MRLIINIINIDQNFYLLYYYNIENFANICQSIILYSRTKLMSSLKWFSHFITQSLKIAQSTNPFLEIGSIHNHNYKILHFK